MALLASSTVPEVEQKLDNNVPHAIKLVMAMSSASPELTVGEHNKRLMISRSTLWILAVFRPSAFILFSAGTIYATRGWDYQWCLPVVLLSFIYQAAVMFVLGHLALFVPRTPFSVCEALDEVGFKEIGLGVLVSTAIVVLFFYNQPWVLVTWAGLLAALIATVLKLWLCLVRVYGNELDS
ncbi:hypothetical protein BS78_08G138500 [Paspalum vaginatum]|nr:hypothetical protein BS78_08G138500 [Paspalum vaginatum]